MSEITVSKELSSIIKRLRKLTSTTAKELAEKIDRSTGYISNIENGKVSKIELYDIINIFEFFNDRANSIQEDKSGINIKEQCSNIINNFFLNESEEPLDDKELMERQEFILFDKQFRTIQITPEYIKYVSSELEENNITAIDVIRELNTNRHLPNAEALPKNKLILNSASHSIMTLSIAFELDETFLSDILDNKRTTSNYINLQGIIYAIYILKGMSSKKASVESNLTLLDCKIYNLIELRQIMTREGVNMILPKPDSSLPKDYVELVTVIHDIVDVFLTFNEKNHEYTMKKLSDLLNNLKGGNEVASFTFGSFGLPFDLVSRIGQEERTDLLNDIVDLIKTRCTNSQKSAKIDLY